MKQVLAGISMLALAACTGDLSTGNGSPSGPDAGAGQTAPDAAVAYDDLDKDRARARFRTTTDLMRYVIAPGCAAERNECHSNEDFPDLSTEGNLWNLAGLPCNQGVGDRLTVEDRCEALGDQLRITDGANAGFSATVGSIELVTGEDDEFSSYVVRLDTTVPQAQTGGTFELVRDGEVRAVLGGGSALDVESGADIVTITEAAAIPDPTAVKQGDENQNGVYGDGEGVLVRPGDMRGSYLMHRLTGIGTERVRMPLNENADNPTELNRPLTLDELYAIGSWINCMQPGDGPYSPIRYDCEANADNEGIW